MEQGVVSSAKEQSYYKSDVGYLKATVSKNYDCFWKVAFYCRHASIKDYYVVLWMPWHLGQVYEHYFDSINMKDIWK